jgi:prepilin-type N-terminal cleavage/methylation domain-containing protein
MRKAFTLIELLVVIAIIGILMALTMAGLTSVRDSGKRMETLTEIAQISEAASFFKSKYGIPPPLSGGGNNGTFRLCTSYLDGSGQMLKDQVSPGVFRVWPEIDAILAVFPRTNLADTGLRHPSTGGTIPNAAPMYLDGNQAMLFWLCGADYTKYQGFATHPRQPFKPPTGDPNEKRRDPFFHPVPHRLRNAMGDVDGHYRDPYGMPYACLGHVDWAKGYPAVTCFGVSPFIGENGKPWNPNSVQIISAGKNKQFGPGGAYTPGSGAYDPSQPGADDLANFRRLQLGAPGE